EDATVGDGERTTGHVIDAQLAVLRLGAVFNDLLLDIGETQSVNVTNDRHNQTTVSGNGNADVLITVIDHVVTVNRRVNRRETLQGFSRSLGKKRHKAQLDAVAFNKALLVLLAQLHNGRHVDFVEGGQHRSRLLCINQTLSNACPQASHRNTFLGAFTLGNVQFRHG